MFAADPDNCKVPLTCLRIAEASNAFVASSTALKLSASLSLRALRAAVAAFALSLSCSSALALSSACIHQELSCENKMLKHHISYSACLSTCRLHMQSHRSVPRSAQNTGVVSHQLLQLPEVLLQDSCLILSAKVTVRCILLLALYVLQLQGQSGVRRSSGMQNFMLLTHGGLRQCPLLWGFEVHSTHLCFLGGFKPPCFFLCSASTVHRLQAIIRQASPGVQHVPGSTDLPAPYVGPASLSGGGRKRRSRFAPPAWLRQARREACPCLLWQAGGPAEWQPAFVPALSGAPAHPWKAASVLSKMHYVVTPTPRHGRPLASQEVQSRRQQDPADWYCVTYI